MRLIVKTDVQGSLEAITTSLEQIDSKKAEVEFVHTAVGPISESDVQLASASNAVVIGFNTKLENVALVAAKREGVEVKLYSIIYELIDQVKESMAGLLDPESRETVIGHAEGQAGVRADQGQRGRLHRHGRAHRAHGPGAGVAQDVKSVYDGGLATLRRFQDDVKEVRSGLGVRHQARGLQRTTRSRTSSSATRLEKIAQKL